MHSFSLSFIASALCDFLDNLSDSHIMIARYLLAASRLQYLSKAIQVFEKSIFDSVKCGKLDDRCFGQDTGRARCGGCMMQIQFPTDLVDVVKKRPSTKFSFIYLLDCIVLDTVFSSFHEFLM